MFDAKQSPPHANPRALSRLIAAPATRTARQGSPFPVSPRGKPGRGKFPPRRHHWPAPPARGFSKRSAENPLARSPWAYDGESVQSETMLAAKQESDVFPSAAFCLLAENSHRGHQLPTAVLHRAFEPINSNTATGFEAFLYDSGRRSRSTGKERDSETGLDYFGARYFSGAQGRFTSPDWAATPEAVPYATLADPQTLNLYGYVRNNPLKSTDPTGHCPICLAEEFFASPEGQAITEEGSALLQKAVAVGLVLGAATLDNARPPSYVPGGSLTDEKGNSIFSSNTRSENSNGDNQQADTVRAGKREAMRQEGIPTSQQPDSQISTEGGRQATYTVPSAGGGKQTKVVTVNHNDESHPGETHVEAGNAKPQGQTDSLGRLRVVNDKTKIDIKKPNTP